MINKRLFDHYGIDTDKDLGIKTNCPRPFDTVLIDKQGSCYACECTAWLPQSIGNLQIQPLSEILNSDIRGRIQSSITDDTYRYCNSKQCAWLLDKKMLAPWSTSRPENRIENLRLAIDESCNLQCPSCRTKLIFHKNGSNYRLGIRLADRVIDWLQHIDHALKVHIGSDGDPFASHIYRHFMQHTPIRDNIKFSILTNGLMFKEFHTKVPNVITNLAELGVSIDGASKVTYEKLRLGGKWEKIKDNLSVIGDLRSRQKFRFVLHFVVQKDNYHEMKDIIKLGKACGADRVYLNRITNWQTFDNFGEQDIADPSHPEHEKFAEAFADVKTPDGFVRYPTIE